MKTKSCALSIWTERWSAPTFSNARMAALALTNSAAILRMAGVGSASATTAIVFTIAKATPCRQRSQLSAGYPSDLISRATIRRVIGATTRTTQNATGQLKLQEIIHEPKKTSLRPMARNVAIPDTMHDIIPERMSPNKTCAKRAGNIF